MTQKSTTAIIAEITQQLAANSGGNITGPILQSVLTDMANSYFNIITNGGFSGTITTAKLTTGGTNGSMTYVSGILTVQTAAT